MANPRHHVFWTGRRVLCVCQRGNSRSVCLAWMLKDGLGANAIAVGVEATDAPTMTMLGEWAETIILTEAVKPFCGSKLLLTWDVGSDRYFRKFSRDLIEQFQGYFSEFDVLVGSTV